MKPLTFAVSFMEDPSFPKPETYGMRYTADMMEEWSKIGARGALWCMVAVGMSGCTESASPPHPTDLPDILESADTRAPPSPPPVTRDVPATQCFGTAIATEGGCVDSPPAAPECIGLVDDDCSPIIPGHRTCDGEPDPDGSCLLDILATVGCEEGCEHAGIPGPLVWPCASEMFPVVAQPEAHILYVDGGAPSEGADGSIEHPWPALNQAINAANAGDTVLIAPGSYAGPFQVAVPLSLKACGAELVQLVGSDSAATVDMVAGGEVTLEGMAIQGGSPGIRVSSATSAFVRDVVLSNARGIGMRVDAQSSLDIQRARIEYTHLHPTSSAAADNAGVSSAGFTHLQQVEILHSEGIGIRAEHGQITGEDVRIENNAGGGIEIIDTEETCSLARFVIADNGEFGVHIVGGKVALTKTRIEGTEPGPLLAKERTALHAEDGALITLTNTTLLQAGGGWALRNHNGFLNATQSRFHCADCAGVIKTTAGSTTSGTGSTLQECVVKGPNTAKGLVIEGSHHGSIQRTLIQANAAVTLSGEDVLLEVEDSRIRGDVSVGMQALEGSRAVLHHSVVISDAMGIELRTNSRLDAISSEVSALGTQPAILADHAAGTLATVRVLGAHSGFVARGSQAQWHIERSVLEDSSFANLFVTESALVEIERVRSPAPSPDKIGSGPFSAVVMGKAHLDIHESQFGTLRIDDARMTTSTSALRAVHVSNPHELIRLEDVHLGPADRSAILVHGAGSTTLLDRVTIQDSSGGIALLEGASMMAEAVDILNVSGPGILALSAEFVGSDLRVESTGAPGIHMTGATGMVQISDGLVRSAHGVGVHLQEGTGFLENVWVEHTLNGGVSGAGDGVISSNDATTQISGGAIQFNERAGFLADDSTGALKNVSFHSNGMAGSLNCVLQEDSQFTLEEISVSIFGGDEDSNLPLPTEERMPPEIYALEIPASLQRTTDP